jgi:hypothetical protein
VLGYPLETVLAEKVVTAIALGPVNTRVRDYADIYTLTGTWPLTHAAVREAVLATARHRGVAVVALSTAIGNVVQLRTATYAAYRAGLGPDSQSLPAAFNRVVEAVTTFADALAADAPPATRWSPTERRWDDR